MHIFLTSSSTGPLDGSRLVNGLDDKNDFVNNLRNVWKEKSRCLMISADPDAYCQNDEMINFFHQVFTYRGFTCSCFDLLDNRYNLSLQSYDVIVLAGGHVPTQNAYFDTIHLAEFLHDFDGIIIAMSAGSMNCANDVYAQPELDGESMNPNFCRHLQGLNLTSIRITPHVQMLRNSWLDGKRLYEDILFKDSYQTPLLGLCDGSYLYIENGKHIVYGQAYWIENGIMKEICSDKERLEMEI